MKVINRFNTNVVIGCALALSIVGSGFCQQSHPTQPSRGGSTAGRGGANLSRANRGGHAPANNAQAQQQPVQAGQDDHAVAVALNQQLNGNQAPALQQQNPVASQANQQQLVQLVQQVAQQVQNVVQPLVQQAQAQPQPGANVQQPTRIARLLHSGIDGFDNLFIKPCVNAPGAIKRGFLSSVSWVKRTLINPVVAKVRQHQETIAVVASNGVAYVLTTTGLVYMFIPKSITDVKPDITYETKTVTCDGSLTSGSTSVQTVTNATCPISGQTIIVHAATQVIAYRTIKWLLSKMFPAQPNVAAAQPNNNNNVGVAANAANHPANGNNH
jgi:hypothetical protein